MDKLIKTLTSLFRTQKNRPMKVKEMAGKLGVPSEEYQSFRNGVRELHREGLLLRVKKGRYTLRGMTELVEGRIRVRHRGDARLQPDVDGAVSVTVASRDRNGAIDRDYVSVMITGETGRGGPRGKVVEVVRRAHPRMSGFSDTGKG